MTDADADPDDGNSDNKAISVQLGWDLTELGKSLPGVQVRNDK